MQLSLITANVILACHFIALVSSLKVVAQSISHTSDGVTVLEEPWWTVKSRSKRQYTLPDMNGFDLELKKELLSKHNELRASRSSSNMMEMKWDTVLERSAQEWANRCVFAHSSSRKAIDGYRYVGENLYAGTGEFTPDSVVQMWFDEWKDYNYYTLRCVPGKMCGHYTQVVWAESRFLGCGVRYCDHLSQISNFNKGYNVVCHYGPGGNIIGFKPFKLGSPCSQCPVDAQSCNNGLCYDEMTALVGDGQFGGGNSGNALVTSFSTSCLTVLMLACCLVL